MRPHAAGTMQPLRHPHPPLPSTPTPIQRHASVVVYSVADLVRSYQHFAAASSFQTDTAPSSYRTEIQIQKIVTKVDY